jgi:hypothetical protein
MRKFAVLLAPVLGSAAFAACTSNTSSPVVACGPDAVAVTNWDVVAVTNYEAAWYYASLDAIPVGLFTSTGAAVAGAVAAAEGRYFQNGCATATASGNVVTFVLHNCSGPLGLVNSSGTVTATLTPVNNTVQIQLAGNNVSANGATVNLATSGTLTVAANGQKLLQATSQSTGTGPLGNSATHMGTYTLVWPTGTGCATLNGTMSGFLSGTFAGTTSQITNYVACTNQCPKSGTVRSAFTGGSTTLTFNGSTNAQCNASNGTSASVPLNCP